MQLGVGMWLATSARRTSPPQNATAGKASPRRKVLTSYKLQVNATTAKPSLPWDVVPDRKRVALGNFFRVIILAKRGPALSYSQNVSA